MTTQSTGLLETLVDSLFDAPVAPGVEVRAAVLLADHLWGVRAGGLPEPTGETASPADVAAERAWAHCRHDRDDIVWSAMVHPGSVVWPTVMVLGEAVNATGPALLRAADIGYETAARLTEVLPAKSRQNLHSTATAGVVAAAAASAALLELSIEATRDALGHAISVMGGSAGALRELSGTRWFHRAHAVRSGVHAALAAERGLGATRMDLDLGGGLLPPLKQETAAALVRPGRTAMAEASLRVFPTSGWNQTAFECAALVGCALVEADETGEVSLTVEVDAPTRAASSGTDWFDLGACVREGLSWYACAGPPASVEITGWSMPGVRIHGRSLVGRYEAELAQPIDHPTRRASIDHFARKWQRPVVDTARTLEGIARAFGDSDDQATRTMQALWVRSAVSESGDTIPGLGQ